MKEKRVPRQRGKGGRPPKDDPAARRLTVNLTDAQHAEFLAMFEQSGLASLSGFIAARIFGDEFRVVKTDASALEFVAKLTTLYGQIRSVGVNYNQVVKQLHTAFGEKKALSLLYKLEQQTIELAAVGRQVLSLCEQFKAEMLE
ncbi:MAG: MobA protein [Rikenellaceae bacterium]|nr:MobA protein [Rikenellaceae bacterium]